MFNIPNESVTQVKKDEVFFISSMGHGEASLCGTKICLKVPSQGLYMGQRFKATGNNKLIPMDKKKPVFS